MLLGKDTIKGGVDRQKKGFTKGTYSMNQRDKHLMWGSENERPRSRDTKGA